MLTSSLLKSVISILAGPVSVALVMLALGEALALRSPGHSFGIDNTILDTQIRRSNTRLPAEIVITGDSSGLVGIDAAELQKAVGIPVQSFSSLGNAGPAAYAAFIDRFRRAGNRINVVVLLVHGHATNRTLGKDSIEATAVGGEWPRAAFGRNLSQTISGWLLDWGEVPFPGRWGLLYGGARGLREAIWKGHGSIADPGLGASCPSNDFKFELSDDVKSRLPHAASVFKDVGATRVMLGLMPFPESCSGASTGTSRMRVIQEIAAGLGISAENILELPPTLPDAMFADFAHLARHGRPRMTELLAGAIKKQGVTTLASSQ